MTSSTPTRQELLDAILKAFGGDASSAETPAPLLAGCTPLNVYMYGSHLHGCAGPHSDYDFVVVVGAPAYFPGIRRVALFLPAPDEARTELDLNVYHVQYFQQLVEQNVVMVLTAVFAPPEATLLERVRFRDMFPLRLPLLRNYISGFLNAKWRRAQHYWKQDKRDSKKIISTVLRYLLLALELRDEGVIKTITSGNDYYHEVMASNSDDWQYYVNKYRPLANSLTKELMEQSPVAKRLISDEFAMPEASSTTLALREFGLDVVCKELAVAYNRHQVHPNLVLLISDASISPLHSPVVRECQGLVVDENDSWKVLCSPMYHTGSYWYEYWSEPAKKKKREIKSKETEGLFIASAALEWGEDMLVYDDLDGIEASLFFYQGEWLLSSRWSADASQPLLDIIDRRKGKHHNPFSFLEEQLQDACEARICQEIEKQGQQDGISTVADLFWDIWRAKGYQLPRNEDDDKCFTFEICSRRYPHIAKVGSGADTERIVLHAVRQLNTLRELDPQPYASKYSWACVNIVPLAEVLALVDDNIAIPFWAREWGNKHELGKRARRRHNKKMNRMRRKAQAEAEQASESKEVNEEAEGGDETESIIEQEEIDDESIEARERSKVEQRDTIVHKLMYRSTQLNPMRTGGLVVMDRRFQRIKIESPQYRILRNMFLAQQPTVQERQMLDFVRANRHVEFLQFYPEWRPLYEDLRERYDSLSSYVQKMYELVKDMDARSYHEWVKENNESLPSSLLYWLNGFRSDQVEDINRLLCFCPLDKLQVLFNQYEEQIRHAPS